jgi:peptidyl-prolyl cis-trans isomerase D
MLTTIREKTQGIIATFILVLIVIPFALWGINSYFERGSRVPVATVNGKDISEGELREAIDQSRERIDPAMLNRPEFRAQVLDGLIERTLLVSDAERQGYRISDLQMAEFIRSIPFLQQNGRFEPALYDGFLRQRGFTTRQFESLLREQETSSQIQSALAHTGIVTDQELEGIVRLLAQERDIAWAVVSPDAFSGRATVDAPAVEAYYRAHPELFQTIEQVRVEYLRLGAADLLRQYQPTEDEIRKAYADEAARYVTPAKLGIAHILVKVAADADAETVRKSATRAQSLAQQLQAGADFAVLAAKNSDDKNTSARGGNLGELRAIRLPKELEEAAKTLKPGAVSAPVRTSLGHHLLKLNVLVPEKRKPLADVRAELVQLLRKRYGDERFYELGEKFRNLVYEQPDSLEPAAKALGLEIQKTDWFARSGGVGVTANPRFVETAFHPDVLAKVRNSDAVEIDNETLAAMRVLDHRPATLRPLAEVRGQIEERLRGERKRELAQAQAQELLKALDSGESLEKLAARARLTYHAPKSMRRDERKLADIRVVTEAFRLPRPAAGKPSAALADLGVQGVALVAVSRVRESDAGMKDKALADKARRLLQERRGSGYYNAYREGLRKQADIKITPARAVDGGAPG